MLYLIITNESSRGKGKHFPMSYKLDILVFSSLSSTSTDLGPKTLKKKALPIFYGHCETH